MGADDAPVVSYVQQLLEKAVALKASDLHFEPYEHHYRVRMRIDGELREIATPPMALKDRLSSRIKVLSRLDTFTAVPVTTGLRTGGLGTTDSGHSRPTRHGAGHRSHGLWQNTIALCLPELTQHP